MIIHVSVCNMGKFLSNYICRWSCSCPTNRSFGAGASLSAVHLALRDADFALITFEEEEEAARAQRAAHGQTWRGKTVQVRP